MDPGGGEEEWGRRNGQLAVQMEGADEAVVVVAGEFGFEWVLGQGGLQPQPAKQQYPDSCVDATHDPLMRGPGAPV